MRYLVAGLFGGIVGGMGMGAGTLLIPILTLMLDVEQKTAQLVNIIAFLPMAILTMVLNAKAGLIRWKVALMVGLPGLVTAICTSMLVDYMQGDALRKAFGIFLLVLGCYFMISTIIKWIKSKRKNTLVDINMTKCDDD